MLSIVHVVALALALVLALPLSRSRAEAGGALPAVTGASELARLRLEHRSARRAAGFGLLGWGAASALGGGLLAAIEHDRKGRLAAGLVTASFGLVNALLAPSLMDLSGARLRSITAERRGPLADLAAIREREQTAQLSTAQTFAFNTGLDVVYISAGLLLYALGEVQSPRVDWQRGAGLALAVQGVPLLAFDIYNWVAANDRAAAIRGSARPRD